VRLAIRLAGILAVLLVTVLVALTVALPRLVGSDAARARIQEVARETTGREIRYGELDFGLVPPRLVVKDPEVKGESDDSAPVFQAAGLELEIALPALLGGQLVVDSLVVEGGKVRLLRTPEGVELPGEAAAAEARKAFVAAHPSSKWSKCWESEPSADATASSREESPGTGGGDDEESGFAFAVRQVALRDSRVLLEDQSVSPPVLWELDDVIGTASGESVGDAIDFEIEGSLASGGSVQAKGEAEFGGPFRIDFQLEDVVLAPLAPYLSKGQRVRGAASGTVATLRTEQETERVSVDVVVRGGELAVEDLVVRGEMKILANLGEGFGDAAGSFQLDATDAEVEYGVLLRKGRGTAATATGRIVTGPDGEIGLQDTEVKIENFEAEVQVETGARNRTTIDAEPFDLTGWGERIPALADLDPSGELGIRGLVVAKEPLEMHGALDLHGVHLRRGEGEEVVLRGVLRAAGSEIRSENLVAEVAGHEIRLTVLVFGLGGPSRFAAKVEADAVESSALLALFTEKSDTLQGPLELRGKLSGPLGSGRPLAETLEGKLRVRIEPGRLKGVSVLQRTFQGVGTIGDAEPLAGRLEGGRTLQRFYDDEFQYLGGTLRIARGLVRSDDLKLVYHNYTVDLRGTVRLRDQQLDLQGKLTIDDEIDGTIANQGAPERKPEPGRSREIPLARVTGTLDSPRVELTEEAVLRLAAVYATSERRDEWKEKIDKYLGEGSGSQVLDTLDGILSGEPREPSQPVEPSQ